MESQRGKHAGNIRKGCNLSHRVKFIITLRSRRLVKKIIYISFIYIASSFLYGQQGCTDPLANNYVSSASINDGSCVYDLTNYTMESVADLESPLLNENSGIVFFNNHLYTINDGGNLNSFFEMDTLGAIIREITVVNATNVDWEALTQNNHSFFIGDFGNNSGSREDLCIYEISKQDILDPQVTEVSATRRFFRYEDQSDFAWSVNSHNYDCEAFISTEDSLFLFSKNWLDEETKLYRLPNTWSDTAVATMDSGFNVDGLITDASIDLISGNIMLLGYKNNGANLYSSFIWMLWDYQGAEFFTGNKRRFEIGSMFSISQTEGLTLKNYSSGYVSSEQINSVITIPPKLLKFNLSEYLQQESLNTDSIESMSWTAYPNPGQDFLTIENLKGPYFIYELSSLKLVLSGEIVFNRVDISTLNMGTYCIHIDGVKIKFNKSN